MTTQPTITQRQAGRVLLLDPDDHVLLLQCQDPGRDAEPWWITPGGGCDEGESHRNAAQREAFEELGFDDLELGPCVWTRSATFPWLQRTICQHERFYVCRIDQRRREPSAVTHTPDELLYLLGHRWWSPADIEDAIQQGTRFAPRRFAQCLQELLRDGCPATPIDVGV